MLRTSVIIAVAALLIGVAPPSHAAPEPRPGKKCPQVGDVHSIAMGILICTKVKKGKRWVKRLWSDYNVGGPSSDVGAQRPDNSPRVGGWTTVYEDIKGRAVSRDSTPGNFDVRYDPEMPPGKWQKVAQLMADAYRPWSTLIPAANPVPLLIMDENSFQWYLSQSRLFPNNNCGASWWMRYGEPSSVQSTGAVCWTPQGNPILLQRVGSLVDPEVNSLTTAHETVHVAQLTMLGNTANSMPCWFGEGQAQVYGAALARGYSLSDIEQFRRQQTQRLGPFISLRGGSSASAWAQVLNESEDRGSSLCLQEYLGYSMGLLAMEKLHIDYGEDAILNWMQGTRDTGAWKTTFRQSFGVTPSEWYSESAGPYIAEELARL